MRTPVLLSAFFTSLLTTLGAQIGGVPMASHATAEVAFPPDAGIVDVTKAPYLADPQDSDRDDTQAIRQALADHAGEGKIIYLPRGVYNISAPIEFPQGQTGWKWSGNRLQGESRELTSLKLKDNIAPFNNAARPTAVIRTTGQNEDWEVAQRFNNDITDLTVQTGRGNPGAIGIQFMSNNTGTIESIRVASADGQGHYGLDFGFADENGPLFAKNLLVEGFDVGISTAHSLNSQTFENVTLRGQRRVGWDNQGQKVAILNLTVENVKGEAVRSDNGNFVLINALLSGGPRTASAIRLGGGYAYLRNVSSVGYQQVLSSATQTGSLRGDRIDEYISHASILPDKNSLFSSLNLTVEETPAIPRLPFSEWVNVKAFGATESAGEADDNNDQNAIQRAIDSGASTLYFPNVVRDSYPRRPGDYEWASVQVRGNVSHIVGTEAQRGYTSGTFVIDKVGPPVVVFERLSNIKIINNTTRTVVVKNASAHIEASGGGKTFLEDVVTGGETSIKVSNGHKLFARQLNPEWNGNQKPQGEPIIDNDGGQVWILGLKTETGGTIIRTHHGGKTEVLGGHHYVIGTPEGGNDNMFVVEDAAFSITAVEANFGGGLPYETYLKSTQGGVIKEINQGDIPYAGPGNDKAFPLMVVNYGEEGDISAAAESADESVVTPKDRNNKLSMLSVQLESAFMTLHHRLRQIKKSG
jgi:hypothetical protein